MSNKMWGGRFSERPGAIMEEINVSIDVDRHLYAQDIAASKAHAAMLAAQGIISAGDAKNIAKGLDTILSEIDKGSFDFKRALEDIHMNVESRLGELIGPAAGRLHTARSRNDQVATDFRLYVRDVIDETDAALAAFQQALIARALEHAATVMPGFTHLQTAQPVTFGHHLLAYVEMAARDRGRFADARRRLNESPLGAAALAGTSFPIDRKRTAKALGFDRPAANSIDAVSDRDFAIETMANKKNPDPAELVRGRAARVIGELTGALTLVKGLPLAYQRDLQDGVAPLLDAVTVYESRNFSMIDIINPVCSKGAALAECAALRGVAREEILAIGDNHNDLEMLTFAGIPVVMGNGVAELKGFGWHETASNDEGGVAAAIEHFALREAAPCA